jgi:hypothetical protein
MKSSFTAPCKVAEDMALLLAQGCRDWQYALDKLTVCATLGPKVPLVLQHNGA